MPGIYGAEIRAAEPPGELFFGRLDQLEQGRNARWRFLEQQCEERPHTEP